MTKKFSTSALTEIQLRQQDELYRQHHSYDYIIIGTGVAALSAGALLANTGYRICMLEAHDIPGGYAHTFMMNDFSFCAQVHYIWGCAPGQPIYEVLKRLGLQEEITFQSLNADGYDHVILPDGNRIKIPYGFDKFIQNIENIYPGQRKNLQQFFSILEKIKTEMSQFPSRIRWWNYITDSYKFINLFKYRHKTLQDVFNACGLNQVSQTIISANSGDLMSPPEELSILAYAGLFGGYNEGAYYPTKHFKFLIDRLARFITDQPGCHIYYETPVSKIQISKNTVSGITTEDGKDFKAQKYICNMDPQQTSYMIGREKFPPNYLSPLSYEYTPSSFMIYLGIKGIDLRDYGFGNHNTWHLEQWDLNQIWRDAKANSFLKPWIFMSTPTLHTHVPGPAPEGCQILEVGTVANYSYFKNLQERDPHQYRHQKRIVADTLLDIIAQKHIPNLYDHIALKVVGSPTTNADFCYAPYGNSYGSLMTPSNMGTKRLKATTPWNNLFWCNASSGFASIYGTFLTGANLYSELTQDRFLER